VTADLRLIVHKTSGSLLLCYVDHHDKSYEWASRRKLETHPQTGAAQMVEIRETVQEMLLKVTGINYKALDEHVETASGFLSLCTMHLAKGLEFRAVAIMACDDEVIPLQERIETVGDDADLQDVYDTERHLLYVACTRARDHLLVTATSPASEFLDDLGTTK